MLVPKSQKFDLVGLWDWKFLDWLQVTNLVPKVVRVLVRLKDIISDSNLLE